MPNSALVAAPLNDLLEERKPSELDALNDKNSTYELLKKALISPPILAIPLPNLPFDVDTDTCLYQVGIPRMQKHKQRTRHPIGY